ncbi:hypothetical protein HK099_005278 [Clydaea vesicula]|uniref:Serine aminopeptidase S33 domain-containing protein n=1 Tax=Clydaea vesicula TaxID=447962 RepID=A0AAD5XZP9_9FUNG|nr:hypothetical protein HK099_005278 [Clydaea vesicula]KAJ3395659.1 hypothetical protein HDU92_005285 [Lobulomyces angularis]
MFFFQPYFVYLHWVNSPFSDVTYPTKYGFRENSVSHFYFNTSDKVTLSGWHVKPRKFEKIFLKNVKSEVKADGSLELNYSELPNAKRVCIYFHGNAGDIKSLGFKKITALEGTHLFTIDYRGFGLSSKKETPSEKGLELDAVAIFTYLTKDLNVDPKKIILIGHSLGSGVATNLAKLLTETQHEYGGLVLVSGYSSVPEASLTYPIIPVLLPLNNFDFIKKNIKYLLSEKFLNEEKLFYLERPCFIVHGLNDYEIKPTMSKSNFFSFIKGLTNRHLTPSNIFNNSFVAPNENEITEPYHSRHFGVFPVKSHFSGEVEGFIWKSNLPKYVNLMWYLELVFAGHNNVQDYELFMHSLNEWLMFNKI